MVEPNKPSPEIVIPNCPRCGAKLIKIKDKNYYGCPNWLPNGIGCEGTVWFSEGFLQKNFPNKAFSYKVESRSNKGHYYIVTVYESGDMSCPCVAGQMNKFCWHKEQLIKRMDKLLGKVKKENYILDSQDVIPPVSDIKATEHTGIRHEADEETEEIKKINI